MSVAFARMRAVCRSSSWFFNWLWYVCNSEDRVGFVAEQRQGSVSIELANLG